MEIGQYYADIILTLIVGTNLEKRLSIIKTPIPRHTIVHIVKDSDKVGTPAIYILFKSIIKV